MKIRQIKSALSLKWYLKYSKNHLFPVFMVFVYNIFNALSGVAMAIASKNLVDNAVSGRLDRVFQSALILAGIIVVNIGSSTLSSLISTRTQEQFTNDMRKSLFARISGTEWIQISKYHSGDVLTRLTSDVNAIASGIVGVVPSIFSLVIQMISAFITLLYFEPYLALLAFAIAPVTVIISRVWGRKLRKLHVRIQELESSYRSLIQESVENMTIIKAFHAEDRKIETMDGIQNERMDFVIRKNRINVSASAILSTGYWLGYFLAFGWGAIRLTSKSITFGTLTAFLQLIGQIQGPFIALSRMVPQLVAISASAGRIMELETLELEKQSEALPVQAEDVEVVFKDVEFSYGKEEKVLDKTTFNIRPHEIIALTGPSGEGKTTIIRLLLALLRPDSGEVAYKGNTGVHYSASAATRQWIAYVPQGNTLFSGTIADNLRFGNPAASDEEIRDAAIKACAWEFIERLPDGLNTVIGENGLGLSEGQAQRISIARAILRKVPVLILDEATSALDAELEMRLLEGIKNLEPARACLIITHRLTALQICSRVIRLQDGKLHS